jgi:hypothetical protein
MTVTDCLLDRCLPEFSLDAKELKQEFNMERIYHTSDHNNPREDVHHPSLVGVIA